MFRIPLYQLSLPTVTFVLERKGLQKEACPIRCSKKVEYIDYVLKIVFIDFNVQCFLEAFKYGQYPLQNTCTKHSAAWTGEVC
jgi:hypothetical protein